MMPLRVFYVLLYVCTLNAERVPIERDTILKIHNEYRREVNASNMMELTWSENLERAAATWAEKCKFEYDSSVGYGQNIAYRTIANSTSISDGVILMLDTWLAWKFEFIYGPQLTSDTSSACQLNQFGSICDYTQMIWADTSEVGCAVETCYPYYFPQKKTGDLAESRKIGRNQLVCFYNPKGNIVGEVPYTIGPPCSNCTEDSVCINDLCLDQNLVEPSVSTSSASPSPLQTLQTQQLSNATSTTNSNIVTSTTPGGYVSQSTVASSGTMKTSTIKSAQVSTSPATPTLTKPTTSSVMHKATTTQPTKKATTPATTGHSQSTTTSSGTMKTSTRKTTSSKVSTLLASTSTKPTTSSATHKATTTQPTKKYTTPATTGHSQLTTASSGTMKTSTRKTMTSAKVSTSSATPASTKSTTSMHKATTTQPTKKKKVPTATLR